MLNLFYAAMARIQTARVVDKEDGQTAVEYALVLVLVAIVLATSLAALSGSLDAMVDKIETTLGVGGGE